MCNLCGRRGVPVLAIALLLAAVPAAAQFDFTYYTGDYPDCPGA